MADFAKKIQKNIWFTFFCLGCFVLFLLLGSWQIERLKWKTDLISSIQEKWEKPPIAISGDENPDHMEFTKIKAMGTFLHNQEILMQGKFYMKENGFYVVTPFKMQDESIIMVNRGWIPSNKKSRNSRSKSLIDGVVQIKGVIRKSADTSIFLPKNLPEKNFWVWRDIPQMQKYFQEKNPFLKVRPIFIQESGRNAEKSLPIKISTSLKIRNEHLQYAITWYSLALLTIIMYIFYIRSQK